MTHTVRSAITLISYLQWMVNPCVPRVSMHSDVTQINWDNTVELKGIFPGQSLGPDAV